MLPRGTRTITPTSGAEVFTWASGFTRRIIVATAVTSSVDITQVPTPRSRTSWVANATARSRQRGIAFTRQGACRTTSAAGESRSAARSAAPGRCSAPVLKLACTYSRSCLVSLASRTRSSAAKARVFTRACPTGSP